MILNPIRCRAIGAASAFLAVHLLFASNVCAQGVAAGIPPDIQAIMDKTKSGQTPTPEELQKLQAYGLAMARAHAESDAPTIDANGVVRTHLIPCNVVCTENWKRTIQPGDNPDNAVTQTGHIDVMCKAQLVVSIHGSGDYYKNLMNPAVGASMFRVQIMTDARGQPIFTGGGQFHFHSVSSASELTADGRYRPGAGCGFVITTTGNRDALYAVGQIGGKIFGKKSLTVKGNTHTDADVDLTDLTIDVPFPHSPKDPRPKPGEPSPAPKMPFSYAQFVTAAKAAHSATIAGSSSFSYDLGTPKHPDHVTGDATLTITIRPPK